MDKLEKTILLFQAAGKTDEERKPVSPLSLLIATLLFTGVMLSVPVEEPAKLLWFGLYPIIASPVFGLSYGRLFIRSLIILPFSVMIGIFNPIVDTAPLFRVSGVVVTRGWVTFAGIQIRSLLAMQAVLILISSYGFTGICEALRKMRVPSFLVTQLLFVYRYLTVLLQEALNMKLARESRGYGKRSYPLRMWGSYIGQLFLRTLSRAERIHSAMLARGFNGTSGYTFTERGRWRKGDTVFILCLIAGLVALRCFDFSRMFQ